ncbi:BMC domain-containing protein [Rahnella aceris]|nr:BMC domain-containing protein [Rahnella aceris]
MPGQSLGLIETVGLAAAIEAADAAIKSAHVTLIGYELTQGGGMVTVKFEGEIGAINAGVAAGVMAASKVGTVYAHKVIARTAQHIECMIFSADTFGITAAGSQAEAMPSEKPQTIPVMNVEETSDQSTCMDFSEEAPKKEQSTVTVNNSQKPRGAGRRK